MNNAQVRKQNEDGVAAFGIVAAYLASVWLLISLVNLANFAIWSKINGDDTPVLWQRVFLVRLNPMIGWDHNGFSMIFPWLILCMAAVMPTLMRRAALRTIIMGSLVLTAAFWLLHDTSTLTAGYGPYYLGICIRALILVSYVIGIGWFVHKRLCDLKGYPGGASK